MASISVSKTLFQLGDNYLPISFDQTPLQVLTNVNSLVREFRAYNTKGATSMRIKEMVVHSVCGFQDVQDSNYPPKKDLAQDAEIIPNMFDGIFWNCVATDSVINAYEVDTLLESYLKPNGVMIFAVHKGALETQSKISDFTTRFKVLTFHKYEDVTFLVIYKMDNLAACMASEWGRIMAFVHSDQAFAAELQCCY